MREELSVEIWIFKSVRTSIPRLRKRYQACWWCRNDGLGLYQLRW